MSRASTQFFSSNLFTVQISASYSSTEDTQDYTMLNFNALFISLNVSIFLIMLMNYIVLRNILLQN